MKKSVPTGEMMGTKAVRGENGDYIDVDGEVDDEMSPLKREGETGTAVGERPL